MPTVIINYAKTTQPMKITFVGYTLRKPLL